MQRNLENIKCIKCQDIAYSSEYQSTDVWGDGVSEYHLWTQHTCVESLKEAMYVQYNTIYVCICFYSTFATVLMCECRLTVLLLVSFTVRRRHTVMTSGCILCTLCVSVCAPYARSGGMWTLCLQCRPSQHMHHDLPAETHAANLGQSALLLEVQLNRNSNHFQSCQHVWFAHLLLCKCVPPFKPMLKLD